MQQPAVLAPVRLPLRFAVLPPAAAFTYFGVPALGETILARAPVYASGDRRDPATLLMTDRRLLLLRAPLRMPSIEEIPLDSVPAIDYDERADLLTIHCTPPLALRMVDAASLQGAAKLPHTTKTAALANALSPALAIARTGGAPTTRLDSTDWGRWIVTALIVASALLFAGLAVVISQSSIEVRQYDASARCAAAGSSADCRLLTQATVAGAISGFRNHCYFPIEVAGTGRLDAALAENCPRVAVGDVVTAEVWRSKVTSVTIHGLRYDTYDDPDYQAINRGLMWLMVTFFGVAGLIFLYLAVADSWTQARFAPGVVGTRDLSPPRVAGPAATGIPKRSPPRPHLAPWWTIGLLWLALAVTALWSLLMLSMYLDPVAGASESSATLRADAVIFGAPTALVTAILVAALVGVELHRNWGRRAAQVAAVLLCISCVGLVLGIPILIGIGRTRVAAPLG